MAYGSSGKLDDRKQRGAIVAHDGQLFEVLRFESRGMRQNFLVCEDCVTGETVDLPWLQVDENNPVLIRAAKEQPNTDAVPMSTECLIADARAFRLAA